MSRNDLDRELTRLQEASQRIAANLVELEIDSGRQLLEASPLTGASAARWAAASAALTDLWAWRALLDVLLERAEKLRHRTRRSDELRALLDGPSIELTRAPVPLAERDLLGSAEVTTHCTPGELIARMSSAFDQAKNVVAEFAEAWNTLTPRITNAHTALEQSRALAAQLGESERRDLVEAGHRLQSLSTALASDPLSVRPDQVDDLIDSLEAIRREFEESTKLRGALDARLADARARLANLTTIIQEARTAHEELAVKVAVPTAPPAAGARGRSGRRARPDRAPGPLRCLAGGPPAARALDVPHCGAARGRPADPARQPGSARGAQPAPRTARGLPGQGGPVARDRGSRARADLRPGSRRPVHRANRSGARGPARAPLSGHPERGAAGAGGGAMNCSQPGCTGLIVDGYCDLCG
ncbi:MAG: hypothetical protein WAL38_25155, partial [Solirubrobacteraceae bacterium]